MVLHSPHRFRISDVSRIVRAIATNALAGAMPRAYIRLTGQTGRGSEEESARQVADYFRACLADYLDWLGAEFGKDWLHGKRILEYGPGDVPGVALLLVAHGAEHVTCVDRFPMLNMSDKNVAILTQLLDGLAGVERARAESCFRIPGDPASGFAEERITYTVGPNGLSMLEDVIDVVLSRAVLEHVNDLTAIFADMWRALKPGGICIHNVDLRSHGLHRQNRLDFLAWSPLLWWCMYGNKGVPNRWRIDRYRAEVTKAGFALRRLESTETAAREEVAAVRPHLARPFRGLSDEDLAWLGFWLICEKPRRASPAALRLTA